MCVVRDKKKLKMMRWELKEVPLTQENEVNTCGYHADNLTYSETKSASISAYKGRPWLEKKHI